MRIVLADDHVPTRAGVRAALEADGFDVCAEAGDAAGALAAALEHRPDLCLLDVEMPGSGITAAGEITAQAPDVAVVMLTISEEDDDLLSALRAGARGFLSKDMNPDRLGAALRGVMAGEAAIPRRLVNRLIDQVVAAEGTRRRRDPRFGLTEREWQIVDGLSDGATTKQIARSLDLSDVTVRRHISRIVQKMGAADRHEVVRLASGGEPDSPA